MTEKTYAQFTADNGETVMRVVAGETAEAIARGEK